MRSRVHPRIGNPNRSHKHTARHLDTPQRDARGLPRASLRDRFEPQTECYEPTPAGSREPGSGTIRM
jgi:hypothetical protein